MMTDSPAHTQLLEYIQKKTASGTPKREIKQILITKGGWPDFEVEKAFKELEHKKSAPVPVTDLTPHSLNAHAAQKRRSVVSTVLTVLILLTLLAIIGVIGYAYYMKLGPFTDPNWLQNIMDSLPF